MLEAESDRGDFALVAPDSIHSRTTIGTHIEITGRAQGYLFEIVQISVGAAVTGPEAKDRVNYELAGTVIGDISAAWCKFERYSFLLQFFS